jgi:hypothetical protein
MIFDILAGFNFRHNDRSRATLSRVGGRVVCGFRVRVKSQMRNEVQQKKKGKNYAKFPH